jgi:hypothetical protein
MYVCEHEHYTLPRLVRYRHSAISGDCLGHRPIAHPRLDDARLMFPEIGPEDLAFRTLPEKEFDATQGGV